jgi:type I restriction enzyme S subunit
MAGEWKSYRLEDLCDFINGFAFKSTDYVPPSSDTVEVFRMGYIQRGGGFKEDDSPVFVPRKYGRNLDKYFLQPGDITIAMTDMKDRVAILGNTAWIRDAGRFVMNQRVGCIRVKRPDLLEPRFLYFYSNWSPHVDYLRSRANSGVQVNLSTSSIKESELTVPPLAEQYAITAVLGELEDKIELNRQMIATLEAMARALFQSWFVDFIPVRAKLDGRPPIGMDATTAALFPASFIHDGDLACPTGWRRSPVTEEISLTRGIEPGRDACNSNRIGKRFIRVGDVTGKRESDLYTSIETEVDVKVGEILVSFDGTPGAVSYLSEGIFSSGLRKLEGLRTKIHPCYLWCLAKSDEFQGTINEYAIGTTILHASAAIPHLRQVVSSPEVMNAFGSIVDPIWKQMLNLHAESRTLAILRDTLLPKLLSGELSIN